MEKKLQKLNWCSFFGQEKGFTIDKKDKIMNFCDGYPSATWNSYKIAIRIDLVFSLGVIYVQSGPPIFEHVKMCRQNSNSINKP